MSPPLLLKITYLIGKILYHEKMKIARIMGNVHTHIAPSPTIDFSIKMCYYKQ